MKTKTLIGCATVGLCLALAGVGSAAASPADDAVAALLDEDFKAQMRADPVEASRRGLSEYDGLLADLSPGALAAFRDASEDRLAELRRIDTGGLTDANRLNAALLEYTLIDRIEGLSFHPEWTPISQQSGVQIYLPELPDNLSIKTAAQRDAYLQRLRAVPGHIRQTIENMRAGLEAGWVPPKIVLRGIDGQLASLTQVSYLTNPGTHPMCKPFVGMPRGDERAAECVRLVSQEVFPAFVELRRFMREEYLPGCSESIGASELPNGEAYYAHKIRSHTTTDLSALEIHEIGKGEVARIRDEMFGVIARSDFPQKDELRGDELFRAFTEYLRTDERFYHTTGEELLAGYRDICKRMDAELPGLFGRLPRLPYGVREMPAFFAPSAPTAYYYPGSLESGVAGYFVANTHDLRTRPKYEMVALALHEAVPGHHLQIAIAQELESAGLPEWRTTIGYTAYVEGWGLYSERIGLDAGGFYDDPYDDFGRLSYEMWRAMRLVVDTGMHAFGWSRQRAIDFMLANSALSEANVVSEVDRYIAWPGQALGYKIGELKIREIRERAERELSERFDIRAFHDALLWDGALPLGILEDRMRDWIETQR